MSVTYGFYSSLNGDRKYSAEQLSSIFDGIICDGVYSTIGNHFFVKPGSSMNVVVGTGRSWFNHTWTLNDNVLPLPIDGSDLILDRIDTVVIEVDASRSSRANRIRVIKGTPSSYPYPPKLVHEGPINQYPLADVRVNAKSIVIRSSDIKNRVGTSDCPFVTGVITSVTVDELLTQWEAEWNIWFSSNIQGRNEQLDQLLKKADDDINAYKRFIQDEIASGQTTLDEWIAKSQKDFDTWFANLQATLDGDVAAKLTKDVSNLQVADVKLEKRVVLLEAQWNTLVNDHVINYEITDYENKPISGSDNTDLRGSIKYIMA